MGVVWRAGDGMWRERGVFSGYSKPVGVLAGDSSQHPRRGRLRRPLHQYLLAAQIGIETGQPSSLVSADTLRHLDNRRGSLVYCASSIRHPPILSIVPDLSW